jgi:hypothetical protein
LGNAQHSGPAVELLKIIDQGCLALDPADLTLRDAKPSRERALGNLRLVASSVSSKN